MTGPVTLDELYVLVPSAEEYDLAEEAEVERLHGWLVKEYAALLGPLTDDLLPGVPAGADAAAGDDAGSDGGDDDDGEDDEGGGPAWRPSDAQALGCLEHLLGAEVVPPADDPPTTPPATPPTTPPDGPPAPDGTAADPAG
jgi:hypothetical protein